MPFSTSDLVDDNKLKEDLFVKSLCKLALVLSSDGCICKRD